ncbi:MAG: gamma carbonic anhydrase family protein, partial [Bacteroidota bacterium]|nr:gamma carbonic anhydrase family protein [Bacteroidota bacterium]
CIVHGAYIGKNALIGMNAVIMDDAQIGENSIIGALSFVRAEMVIPNRKVVAGNPAKIIKDVSDEMISWKSNGTELYQKLPNECHTHLKETTSLKSPENQDNKEIVSYKTWKKTN